MFSYQISWTNLKKLNYGWYCTPVVCRRVLIVRLMNGTLEMEHDSNKWNLTFRSITKLIMKHNPRKLSFTSGKFFYVLSSLLVIHKKFTIVQRKFTSPSCGTNNTHKYTYYLECVKKMESAEYFQKKHWNWRVIFTPIPWITWELYTTA